MKTVGILGYGYVGKAVTEFFKDHFKVVVYDINFPEDIPDYVFDTDKIDLFNEQKPDLVVSCLPTPMRDDGACDTSIVESVLSKVDCDLILIKSTIPPGTTLLLSQKLNKDLCFSPEYIGEGKYFVPFWKYPHPTDMKYHNFVIVGSENLNKADEVMEFFKKVLGPDPRFIKTDSKTAELCKYMENSWGAMKVTFCNEFFEIAQAYGINYDELRELWLLDSRVERMHTAVFKDHRGFDGKCYPKDVNAIVKACEQRGFTPKLMKQVLNSNDDFVAKNV